MADGKKKTTKKTTKKKVKPYILEIVDGNFHFRVIKPDGIKGYSISGPYPIVCQTASGMRRLTKKETLEWCIRTAKDAGRL